MLTLQALDGHQLQGTLFDAPASRDATRVAVIHGGAGIAAARYRHLAGYLAGRGIPTLTYDYRGIGQSRRGSLRGLDISMEDWAEYDCGGALAWLRARYPRAEILGVAHSVGTLLYGGAPNAGEHGRVALVGAHTGYFADYRLPYRVPMTMLWHGLMPAITRIAGYFPGKSLALGEDMPRGVALQWAGRLSPGLRVRGEPNPRLQVLLDRCAQLRRPAIAVSISDDAFATSAGERRLLSCYPGLDPVRVTYSPADAGVSRIGHLGFFARAIGPALWPRLHALLYPTGDAA